MKINLIRFIFLVLFFSLEVFASTYKWSVEADKESIFVNEAVHLKYSCEFSDRGELYVIDFDPVSTNENYTLVLLRENTQIKDAKRINTYEYIAYIHKAGEIELSFDAIMKKTNKDSIENTVMGRDNGEYEEYTKTTVKHEKIVLNVKENSAKLVGTLELKLEEKNTQLKSYEPYNLEIILSGLANFDALNPLEFHINGVKVFTQEPIQDIQLTKHGYKGQWRQKFAFVSDKDFSIPGFEIKYFDLKSQEMKSLVSKEIQVQVSPAYKRETLLDKEEQSYSFSYDFIYYILTFIAGFLVAKIKFKKKKQATSKELLFKQKIEKASSLDALVFALVLENQNKYQELIRQIENKEIVSLKEAKKLIAN